MPNFAANLMFLFTELPLMERFAAARACGFDIVEYQFPYGHDLSAMRDALAENNLRMALINAPCGDYANGERGIAADPDRTEEFKDSFLEALAYARELGCPRIHVMSGIVDPDEKELATEIYAENLRLAARAAEAAGINVVVEPLNGIDVPGYLVQRAAQARAIIAMVADPNLALQYDAYHALMNGEDPIEGLRANLDIIRHIQAAGCPGRHEPNTGDYDLNAFFEVCDMIGYTGVIGLEYAPANGTEAGLGWAAAYGLGRSA